MTQSSETAQAIGYALSVAVHEGRLPVTIDCEAIAAALERARVVGVLDAWALAKSSDEAGTYGWQSHTLRGTCECYGKYRGAIIWSYTGPTPDAARAAAAKAIENGEV